MTLSGYWPCISFLSFPIFVWRMKCSNSMGYKAFLQLFFRFTFDFRLTNVNNFLKKMQSLA